MNYLTLRHIGLLLILALLGGCQASNGIYEVTSFGAKGNGQTLDTKAVNHAIEAASKAGGGTVHFAPGIYLCYSIHLKSNVSLYLENGATIKAAGTVDAMGVVNSGEYDAAEPNTSNHYQDFGHTHWHNSLIWGEDVQHVGILGPGLIDGSTGLNRGHAATKPSKKKRKHPVSTEPSPYWYEEEVDSAVPQPSVDEEEAEAYADSLDPDPVMAPTTDTDEVPSTQREGQMRRRHRLPDASIATNDYSAELADTRPDWETTTKPATQPEYPNERDNLPAGIGNKAISLKNSHDVTIRDISVFRGGHFAILATAVDGLTIDNVKLDTNRDGMDIDCCKNVRVSNCAVNSPHDDGICLKSSFGLGYARDTENVTITNCFVTGGYVEGSMLDGTFKKIGPTYEKGHTSRTGRIKFGTESNGGFKNIAISNCIFDNCEGLAIEAVDGGIVDNVAISNIAMRDITSDPIFIRLGARLRGPKDTPVGAIRHITISNVIIENAAARFACFISGIPGHEIEDLHIHNLRILYPGGGTQKWADRWPSEQVSNYPDPTRFGGIPAYGLFARHVNGLDLTGIDFGYQKPDARPPIILRDVKNVYLQHVTAQHEEGTPTLVLKNVDDFTSYQVRGLKDMQMDRVEDEKH